MIQDRLYISTIASDANQVARQYGLGLEIAEYCTAWNMDQHFSETHAQVTHSLSGIQKRILHAPFNELFPCAIDPKARELAVFRYRQAIALAKRYGASKVIIHGGYSPRLYYPCWFTAESVKFWQEFLRQEPGVEIVLENVMEEEPEMLLEILRQVNYPSLRLCLDVGHVNVYSHIPVTEWLEACAPWLSHLHLHNNDGTQDTHSALYQGTIPMDTLLRRAETLCPQATMTLELTEAAPSVRALLEESR